MIFEGAFSTLSGSGLRTVLKGLKKALTFEDGI